MALFTDRRPMVVVWGHWTRQALVELHGTLTREFIEGRGEHLRRLVPERQQGTGGARPEQL